MDPQGKSFQGYFSVTWRVIPVGNAVLVKSSAPGG